MSKQHCSFQRRDLTLKRFQRGKHFVKMAIFKKSKNKSF